MISVRIGRAITSASYPHSIEGTARWALRQAARKHLHVVSDLDVLRRTAELAQVMVGEGYPVQFRANGRVLTPEQVLAALERGEDVRPKGE